MAILCPQKVIAVDLRRLLAFFSSMFHITDWFTTMLRLANVDVSGLDVDGLDQWDTLQDPSNCASKSIVYYSVVYCN